MTELPDDTRSIVIHAADGAVLDEVSVSAP